MDTKTVPEEAIKIAQRITPGCFGEQGAKCGPDGPCELHYRVSGAILDERQRWYDSNKALHVAWKERDKALRYLKLYDASDRLGTADAAQCKAILFEVRAEAFEEAAKVADPYANNSTVGGAVVVENKRTARHIAEGIRALKTDKP